MPNVEKTGVSPIGPKPNPTLSKTAGFSAFLLFIAILICDYADQAMLSPFLNTLLLDFFNDQTNVVPFGWINFTFTMLSAFSMVIAGIYADIGSRKKICFFGSILYSTMSILTFFTPHGQAGYSFYFITRALNGIGIGTIVPSVFALVSDTVEAKKRATSMAYLNVAQLLGRMVGMIMAGIMVSIWRTAYLTIGVINLILAFGLIRVKEPKKGAQEEELKDVLTLEVAQYSFRLKKEDIKVLWKNKSNFWLIMNFVDTFPGSIILFLLFKYMEDVHNITPGIVNVIIILVAIFGAIGTMLFGKLGDWAYQKDKRAKIGIALFCNFFPIIFAVIFLSTEFWVPDNATFTEALAVPGVLVLVLSITVAMFINQGVGPNWYSSVIDVNLPEHRATMISLATFMDMLGNAIGPLLGSYIATNWGIQTAMWSIIGWWILNAIIWIPVFFYIRGDLAKMHDTLEQRAKNMQKDIQTDKI